MVHNFGEPRKEILECSSPVLPTNYSFLPKKNPKDNLKKLKGNKTAPSTESGSFSNLESHVEI